MPDPLGDIGYTWPFYAAAVLGYLLGSIPFGLLVVRLAGLGDIRRTGSGNIGMANVLRTGRRDLAALTLLLDGGKGALAVLVAGRFGPDLAVLAGGGAMVGHALPVWLKFRGGKGVATMLGTLLALAPPVGGLAVLAWAAVAAVSRIASVASLSAALAAVAAAWGLMDLAIAGRFWSSLQILEFTIFVALIVWLKHLGNLRRLAAGTEPRLGRSAPPPGPGSPPHGGRER
jgi:glycerol-3-phosphate acyltransferase PlsY